MADLEIATLTGDYTVIGGAQVDDFRASLHGESLLPGDEGYDGARHIWNAMVDKRPRTDRPLQRNGRCHQLGQLCQGERPPGLRARRRP